MTYQEIIQAIESLPIADRNSLLEQFYQAVEKETVSSVDKPPDKDEVHYVDRDGNLLSYQAKDLYSTAQGYNYVTNQGKIFDNCLPDLVSKYAGEYIVFEDGRVIDRDIDESTLLDRVWKTEFA